MTLGGILTAMITPFDGDGRVDEDATARLIRHLLENGSDGVVVAGTTGEGATLDDDEKCRLFEIAVEVADGAPVIAGTGSNDTAHSVHLSARAAEIGVDAALVVTPYYNKPNARGIIEHFRAVAAGTDLPIIAYNIPSRCVVDIPNDLLQRLADQVPTVTAVKQARYEDLAALDGIDLLAGNDDMLADVMDAGGTGGITVASHLVGTEMRRIIDEPENRHDIEASLRPLYEALSVTTNPMPIKTAVGMIGLDTGGLPPADGRSFRRGRVNGSRRTRAARAPEHGLSGTLRILPLGGLGEIGKNMTVVEYDDRIVVVDTGLMFPKPDQLGIDLVLPDFAYLRERAERHRGDRPHARPRGPRGRPSLRTARVAQGRSRRPRGLRRSADDRDGSLEARRAQAQGGPPGGRQLRAIRSRSARSPSRWSRWPTRSRTRSPWP